MSTKNIVLCGETGAGKSSIVNLMAEERRAKTSPGTERCTMQWEEHSITFDGHSYNVFDTIGLEDRHLKKEEYLEAIVNAHNLIEKLDNEGGIDLLLFCVRAGRITATLQSNYRLFYEWLCEKKVPIVLVFTGLEREQNMEDWWIRNQDVFQKYDIYAGGHACITAVSGPDGRHQQRYEVSRRLVCDLVIKHTHGKEAGAWKGGDGWFSRFVRMLRGLFPGNVTTKKRNLVTVLTGRCAMPQDVAVELVGNLEKD